MTPRTEPHRLSRQRGHRPGTCPIGNRLCPVASKLRTSDIPPESIEWYADKVNGTYPVTMGDRGRLVIPAELRAQAGLTAGTPVVLIAAPGGVLLVSREQLKSLVREDLAGLDLVRELLADRRRQAAAEDAA
jgi:AbrB family looped-hinge helix DNA binding protein